MRARAGAGIRAGIRARAGATTLPPIGGTPPEEGNKGGRGGWGLCRMTMVSLF